MSGTIHVVCPFCDSNNRVLSERLADQVLCGRCKHPLFPGTPLELTTKNFEQHVNHSDIPLLVDFWAPWCGPCRTMAPVISQAAKELEPSLRVAKLNTEAESELAMRFAIRSIPTLAIFYRGNIVNQQSGAIDLTHLLLWVKSVITTLK